MKKTILTLVVALLSYSVYSQDLIAGIEFAEEGTIYLNDKDSIQGVLGFSYIKNNQVMLVGEKETKYKPEDIKGFYLKTSKLNFISGTFGLGYKAFLQVVVPGKKARVVKTFVTTKGVKIEPGKPVDGTWSMSLYLVDKGANFENSKKIAEAIKGECPELATKLTTKNSGYFVNLLTIEEDMLSAYKKIIEDLDAGCK
jgi:hypothetical protein